MGRPSRTAQVRDRVRELRRVRADLLRPHPRNWRVHPDGQRAALAGVLGEVGFADALLVRELADGTYELIDGHLRAESMGEQLVPVLVLDLSEAEAEKLLAVHDPLTAMAEVDAAILAELRARVETEDEAVRALLDRLTAELGDGPTADAAAAEIVVPETFQVVVECADEAGQRTLFERLESEGYRCRLLTLS